MAVPRGQTPPVNLKERIAALQQRNVSPNTHQSAQAAPRGIPSPGSGGLRDKIAKFEEKGGVPVPRGSFAMGAPQLAENAPPKKRGELYGNRVPGLGKPSGPPVSRSGSPDDSPSPRKRCISTGTGLSTTAFSTDEPVPALPDGLPGSVPRRNSLAVHFGSGRRVMSTSDAGGHINAASPSPSSLVPEGLPIETTGEQSPAEEATVGPTTLVEVEESQPSGLESPKPSEPPSAGSGNLKVDEDPPVPQNRMPPIRDTSQNVSQSSTAERSSSKDGYSDYESAPQSAISQPSLSFPEPPPSVPPSVPPDTPSTARKFTPTPEEAAVASLAAPPTERETDPVDSATIVTAPDSTEPPPSSPALNTDARPPSKPTFKAVVHRRVSELPIIPAASSLSLPAVPQATKQRRAVNGYTVEVPPSLGHGDLAVLLEDAALLEQRLTEGDGTGSKGKDLTAVTPTTATFQPDPRYAPASSLTEHASVPSIGSGSQSTRSVSIPSIRESLVDGEIPEEDETDGRSLASTTFSQRSLSHRKYLSNIYRLTGRRSSSYMPGTYPRDSMSLSSEDSSPVTTPSDNGKRKGFGIAWPTSSPKRGGPNISRSSSFADKIFNRNRTRSNASTADQVSERNSLYESSQPSLTLSFPSELSSGTHPDGVDVGARSAPWISPVDSNSEFSPTSSVLDKDIFDAFPSVPQTLPPGFYLDAENSGVGRASTLPVKGRKQVNQRLSIA